MELETTKIEIINGCWIRVHNRTCNLPVSNFCVKLIFSNALERHRSISAVNQKYIVQIKHFSLIMKHFSPINYGP